MALVTVILNAVKDLTHHAQDDGYEFYTGAAKGFRIQDGL